MVVKFLLCLCLTQVFAQPTTPGATEAGTTLPPMENAGHTELLRQNIHVVPTTYKQRGRVVLATTHVEGSDQWGVTADEAETSCQRIALIDPSTISKASTIKRAARSENKPMEGHLVSFGSSFEVVALSRLLQPLPDEAFWTGGKIARYRKFSTVDDSYTDHALLTWSDGRGPDLSVLGMTEDDKLQLKEDYVYCLALNLRDNTWQARDCSDKLPYVCLITPRRVRFSNQARFNESTTSDSNSTTTVKPKQKQKVASVAGRLMQNVINENGTTPTPEVTQEPTESSPALDDAAISVTPVMLVEDLQTTTPLVTAQDIEGSETTLTTEETTEIPVSSEGIETTASVEQAEDTTEETDTQ